MAKRGQLIPMGEKLSQHISRRNHPQSSRGDAPRKVACLQIGFWIFFQSCVWNLLLEISILQLNLETFKFNEADWWQIQGYFPQQAETGKPSPLWGQIGQGWGQSALHFQPKVMLSTQIRIGVQKSAGSQRSGHGAQIQLQFQCPRPCPAEGGR